MRDRVSVACPNPWRPRRMRLAAHMRWANPHMYRARGGVNSLAAVV